jgi:hypothetical protein
LIDIGRLLHHCRFLVSLTAALSPHTTKSVSTTSIFSIFDHEALQDRFFLSDPTTVGHKDQIA